MKTLVEYAGIKLSYGRGMFTLSDRKGRPPQFTDWKAGVEFFTLVGMSTEPEITEILQRSFVDDPLLGVFRNWLEAPGIDLSDAKSENWDQLADRYPTAFDLAQQHSYQGFRQAIDGNLLVEDQAGISYRSANGTVAFSADGLVKAIAQWLSDPRTRTEAVNQWAPFLIRVFGEAPLPSAAKVMSVTATPSAATDQEAAKRLATALANPLSPFQLEQEAWFGALAARHGLH